MGKELTLITSPAAVLIADVKIDVTMELWEVFRPGEKHDPMLLRAARERALEVIQSGAAKKIHEGLTRKATRMDIVAAIAELIAAWPSAKSSDLQIFSRLVAEHVEAISPCRMALLAACSAIIANKTFMPAVAEVRAAVQDKHDFYKARADLVMRLPQRVIDVQKELEQ